MTGLLPVVWVFAAQLAWTFTDINLLKFFFPVYQGMYFYYNAPLVVGLNKAALVYNYIMSDPDDVILLQYKVVL